MMNINHQISKSCATLRLSEILDTTLNYHSNKLFSLTIVIDAEISVSLIDDLAENSLTQTKITIIAKQNSKVSYSCEFIKSKANKFKPGLTIEKTILIELTEAGAHANASITCFGKHNQMFKFKTIQHHLVKNTESSLIIKGVFDDASQLQCDTLISVEKNAHGVLASQVNKNLLLSPKVRAISIPKLEVMAHQVKCSHGAAFSRLNKEDIFFLQSRGFSENQAKRFLVKAFLL